MISTLYFYANQIYQLSYTLPLYRRAGGVFIGRDIKRLFQLKKNLINYNQFPATKTFLNTPPTYLMDRKKLRNLSGVIVFASNASKIVRQELKAKTIFLGHGTGDKPYLVSESRLENFDFHFASGPKFQAILHDSGIDIPEDRIIKTGNLRFDDIINGVIDKEKELDRLGIIDRERKTVLYAPTWKFGDGTLLKYGYRFAREITQKYNLIIRPHYQDWSYIAKFRQWASKNNIRHLYFSNPSNLVSADTMRDFAASDIMLSDTSSVLYEYLIMRQPIIVIRNEYKNLHKMPSEMDIMQHVSLFSAEDDIITMIDAALKDTDYHQRLEKLLNTCFYFNDGKAVQRAHAFIESINSN